MKKTTTIILLTLFILTSCQSRFIVNEQGGVRPSKNNMFSYNKKNFTLKDTTLIDTNAIYLRKGGITKVPWSDTSKYPTVYYRFWNNGRVQEVWPDKLELNSIVNNTEIGYIGYYYIKKGRLKMQMIEITNGGQTGLRYGLFDKGDIWFYEQRPETYYGSWNMLKWFDSRSKTKWTKTTVDSLKYVRPTW
jgi:hypothetical protein